MKILFVCSGNSEFFEMAPFIKSQGESLKKLGHQVDYFLIRKKGIKGYIGSVSKLRSQIVSGQYDAIHAHYSFCGFVAFFAAGTSIVVSLMGSDVLGSSSWKFLIRFFVKYFWSLTIVKSDSMKSSLGLRSVLVLPNGVDTEAFNVMDKDKCLDELGFSADKKVILFGADPERPEKNFVLAKEAVKLLTTPDAVLIALGRIEHSKIPVYLNAADVLILTSLWEGSPNIVKESMACNCPVISTDVGDVAWLLDGISDCFIVGYSAKELALKIDYVLSKSEKTNARSRLIDLHLDSVSVAKKLVQLYGNLKRSSLKQELQN